ncbi:hypothetical protein [Aminobacter carboxidus]|uniref:Uncharacterized protein n=1 Tax=Aminobacter carboxidus TaxID=376165 RepID=A0ABR9GWR1_9HYPH|nr:hypothetical protein [Aminobacter carboxidus]MBE1208108.1 hypothetical protein [Aminobacter carboxidus]
MARRSLLMSALTALIVLGSSPGEAKNPPRGDVDALALLAMAPQICGINTKARWDAAMVETAAKYDLTIPVLTTKVKKAMGELRRGFAKYPGTLSGQCAAIRRTQ